MISSDTIAPLMSMTNGRMYDSKSALRAEYRRAGVIEVGNDVPMRKPAPPRAETERQRHERRASIDRALSQAGFGAV
ncbi:MAG: hypothetical protein AAF982_06310 [Pseudomonadota bacterium]